MTSVCSFSAAGRYAHSSMRGPPGPPGPPGLPGTFSGSIEDISARIIAYLQRKPTIFEHNNKQCAL